MFTSELSEPELSWNYTGSQFLLETCPVSQAELALSDTSPLTHASTSGLCSPWYPPMVAVVGRRGSEKPEELHIFHKSEHKLGSHPET